MASERPAEGKKPGASWKERYAALAARLAETKNTLTQTREALRAALEHDRATRETLAKVRERLHRYERLLLRPEVLSDLMPARVRHCRVTPPDQAALGREATHIAASDSYAAARAADAPSGADRVQISEIIWWVPARQPHRGTARRSRREPQTPAARAHPAYP